MELEQKQQLPSLFSSDPAAIAAAETARAKIQSAYLMAMQKPRSYSQARAKIMEACKRPEFAERVEYAKPVGNRKIKGASIRFAELAIREWGNIFTETQTIYESDDLRRIRVSVTDLETNSSFSKEIQIKKIVERKSSRGREVIGERTNSYGEVIFIVKATEDELMNKESALISKAVRNEGLRLIPSDIIDDAVKIARSTVANRDAEDPQKGKKDLIDAFASVHVYPRHLEKYLNHELDTVSLKELQDLRQIYTAIRDGETSWNDYQSEHYTEKEETQTIKLDDVLNGKPEAKKPDVPDPEQKPEPTQAKAQGAPTDPFDKSNWIKLKSGFSTFVHQHLEAIRNADESIREELKSKWQRQFNDAWPLDPVQTETIDTTTEEQANNGQTGHSQIYNEFLTYIDKANTPAYVHELVDSLNNLEFDNKIGNGEYKELKQKLSAKMDSFLEE